MGSKKQSLYYKWLILAACFLLMAVPFSIFNTVHTIFINPVTEALNFSLSSFSLIFTISGLVIASVSAIIGNLLNKINIKVIMTTGALLFGLSFIAYSFASAIMMFYFITLFSAVGIACISIIPISTMINNWFGEQKGFAMGVAFSGMGIGSFIFMPIVSRIIQGFGYRSAYVFLGFIILATALPICLFIVRRGPELAFENEKIAEKSSSATKNIFNKFIKNLIFWIFAMGMFIMGLAIAGVQIHVQPYLGYLNYSLIYSAKIGSLLSLFAVIGNVLGGIIFDRLELKKALLLLGGLSLIGIICLFLSENNLFPYIFAVTFGLSLSLSTLWPSYSVGIIFPEENYSVMLGIVNMFFTLGGAVGPFISGVLGDTIGYKAAWILYSAFTVLYLFMFIRSMKREIVN